MYLAIHGVAGMVLGEKIKNVFAAFLISFVFHFILDIIPHDNIELKRWTDKGKEKEKFMLIGALDLGLLCVIIVLLAKNNLWVGQPAVIGGLLGGIAPDLIWVFGALIKTKNRSAVWFRKIHTQIHQLIKKESFISNFSSNAVQLSILIILVMGYIWL